jgi:hypothetical protein
MLGRVAGRTPDALEPMLYHTPAQLLNVHNTLQCTPAHPRAHARHSRARAPIHAPPPPFTIAHRPQTPGTTTLTARVGRGGLTWGGREGWTVDLFCLFCSAGLARRRDRISHRGALVKERKEHPSPDPSVVKEREERPSPDHVKERSPEPSAL